jgi:hypothetical protein
MKNYVKQSLSLVIIAQLAVLQQVSAVPAIKLNSVTYQHQQGSSEYAKPSEIKYDDSKITVNGKPSSNNVIPEINSKLPSPTAGSTAYSQGNTGAEISVTVHPLNSEEKDKDGKTKFVIGDVKAEGALSTDPNLFPAQIRKQMFLEEKKAYAQSIAAFKMQMKTQGATAEWQKTIWGSTLKRFPTETLMFFVAIGVVNTANLLANYANNPLLMEQHLQSLKDPIGNLSFLAFMMANGYAHHFLDRPALTTRYMKKDVEQIFKATIARGLSKGVSEKEMIADAKKFVDGKFISGAKLAYTHLIPYLSMTVGSMASHLVGDYLHTLQACVASFTPQANQKEARAKDPLNNLSQDPCDVAWREWTVEKKFNTFAPALASMMLSQAMATGVSIVSKEGLKIGVFEKVAASSTEKVFTFKLLGCEIIKEMVPGKLAFKAVRLVGHVTNLTMFTALDQLIHHWVQDIVLNINYGRYNFVARADAFPRKAEILYDLLQKESKEKYQNLNPVCEKDLQDYQCQTGDILGFLHNFSETMTKWKEFNKTKPMMAHQNWLQMVNNFQTTEVATKSFYGEFIDDIQQAEYYRKNPIVEQQLDVEKMSNEDVLAAVMQQYEKMSEKNEADIEKFRSVPPMSNYISYPLFGVDPIEGLKGFDYTKWKNLYLSNPSLLEHHQKQKVKQVAKEFNEYMQQRGYDSLNIKYDADKIKKVLNGLNSENLNEVGYALSLMRYYADNSEVGASEVTQAIFKKFLDKLGSPSPLMKQGLGFSYAIEHSERHRKVFKDFTVPSFYRDFGLATQFRFNKKTDYIFYNMLCGPQVESDTFITSKYVKMFDLSTGIPNGLQALFIPPAIVNDNVKADVCSKILQFKNSTTLYTDKIIDKNSNTEYSGIFAIIFKNLRKDLQEIVNSKPKFTADMQKETNSGFENWWTTKMEPKVIGKITAFKDDYHEITVDLFNSLFKNESKLNDGVVMNSIVFSNMQEARTYSMILAHVLKNALPSDQYKALLSSDKVDQKPYKIQYKQDILSFQKAPFMQDFDAIGSGNKANILKFQQRLEEILNIYHNTLKAFAVVKGKNSEGKEIDVVDTKVDDLKINELTKKIEELNGLINQDLDGAVSLLQKDPKAAKAVSVITYIKTQIERISKELTLTFEMVNLMSQKVTDYTKKTLTEEEEKMKVERAKREQEQINKRCNQYKTIGGARPAGC